MGDNEEKGLHEERKKRAYKEKCSVQKTKLKPHDEEISTPTEGNIIKGNAMYTHNVTHYVTHERTEG